ncbi:MAG: helix-turn-helix domain-containing protein [Ilumatobacter fluminis]
MSTLRRKIGDDSDPPTLIVTVRGVGFRFEG